MWNPFRSKLAAAILGGIDKIHMVPGSKVLYLGAASGTTVSHVSDIVGPVSVIRLFKLGLSNQFSLDRVSRVAMTSLICDVMHGAHLVCTLIGLNTRRNYHYNFLLFICFVWPGQ